VNGLVMTAAYTAAAVLGLQWAQYSGAGSPVWPAFGISLAGLLLGGPRLWPAIFVGRFLAGVIIGSQQPLWAELAIAGVNAFADGFGAWLLIRYGRIDPRLPALRDVLWLAFGVAASAAISALLGSTVLAASSGLSAGGAAGLWLGWWLGNVVAGLIVTPLILTWARREAYRRSLGRWLHLAACLGFVTAVAFGVFIHTESEWLRTWHIYPGLIWAALAFNVRGGAAALLITAALALIGATLGLGFISVVDESMAERVLSTQQFAAASALTTLILAAVAHERQRVREAAQLAAIVSSTPDAIVTYSPDGLIRSWNEGAEVLFGYEADEVMGRHGGFLLPPEQPEGPGGVFAMAMEQRQVELDTVRMTKSGERIEVGITASRMHSPEGAVLGVAAVVRDVRALKQRERAIREREAHLSAFFRQSAAGMSEADTSGRFIRVNDRFCAITGRSREELLGMRMHDITHPDDLVANTPLFQRTIDQGESFEIEKRYVRPDGSIVWVHNSVTALRDEAGRALSTTCITIDITDRKRAEEHQRLLINELNHRVKNTLAIVQGIAQQTFKGEAASTGARGAFEGRLAALSQAHNVLTEQNWESACLREIVEGTAAPYRRERFEIDGPDLRLPPKTSVSLALALHELSTNAVKYGALSTPTGRIHISWRDGDGRLKLVWREAGGPPVSPPERRGFGTRMIERGLASELGGDVRIDFAPDGLVCAVDAPLPRMAD